LLTVLGKCRSRKAFVYSFE